MIYLDCTIFVEFFKTWINTSLAPVATLHVLKHRVKSSMRLTPALHPLPRFKVSIAGYLASAKIILVLFHWGVMHTEHQDPEAEILWMRQPGIKGIELHN